MSKLPEWVKRDLKREEARTRILADARAALGVAEEAKKKKKHKYVPNSTAGWYGPHPCAVCGQSESDPDHDGDNDMTPGGDTDHDTASEEAADAPQHTGVMVALFPTPEVAQRLAIQGGEKASELHLTLAYLGKASELGDEKRLLTVVQGFAASQQPLTGNVNGLGLFSNANGVVTWASVDLPALPEFRQHLVKLLDDAGFPIGRDHGYTPHMTLAFADRREEIPPNVDLTFSQVTVAIAGKRYSYDLTGTGEKAAEIILDSTPISPVQTAPLFPSIQVVGGANGWELNLGQPAPARSSLLVATKPHPYEHPASPDTKVPVDLPPDVMGIAELKFPPCALCGMMYGDAVHVPSGNLADKNAPLQRAFVTEAFGRTLLTAPATTWEKALSPNEHFLWMQGRFVGGEKANRNGALWSSKDLELGHPTVAYGPLNWLHESRHIIGTIADAKLIPGSGDSEQAQMAEPHIMAMSAVWKWVYPDEAWVIENASDSGKLWYSMECISKNVECGNCGETAAYGKYIAGDCCQHMRERSATRRFDNPTFLGGAVIVPPVRPGWADADARVLHSEAAALAERTFDDANPQVSASEWELLMGEVLRFASE